MILLALSVLVLVLASATCSGSEAALFLIPDIKVRQMVEAGRPGAVTLLRIRERMSRPIAAIVVLNNLVNIAGSVAVGTIAAGLLGKSWLGVFSAMLTMLVILFAEIIPKRIAENHADIIAPIIAVPVYYICLLMTPLIWIIELITAVLPKPEKRFTNESEIRLLTSLGCEEGSIEKKEHDMIQRVFELNDISVRKIMTPRVVMSEIRPEAKLKDCREKICSCPHSRIVVNAGGLPEKVTGVVLKSDLLSAMLDPQKQNAKVAEFQKPPLFIPEAAKVDMMLALFQREAQHLAVVVDEYGGISGVLTLEDVVEVITGQIVDETDETVDLQDYARRQREPGSF